MDAVERDEVEYAKSLKRGLTMLMNRAHSQIVMSCVAHGNYIQQHETHPFDLEMKPEDPGWDRKILYVGGQATDRLVHTFVEHIANEVKHIQGVELQELRVISVPYPGRRRSDQHYVFFEFTTPNVTVISGGVTDFSGAGNQARLELEDVFAVLSEIWEISIRRIALTREFPLEKLGR